jgi:aminodeoxyfutalosine deaminase
MTLESYLRAAPKAELHVHLEGSILPGTLLELARRNRVVLPADTVEGLREWFVFRDFLHFIRVYVTITKCLRTVEDYELVVTDVAAELARQNVRYAEMTFSPSTHAKYGVPHDIYFTGLTRGRKRAETEHGVLINWIFDIVRDADPAAADYTTGVAIDGMRDGVVALGLGGLESAHPPEQFAPWFERARAAGLHSAPHAGELAGPDSVRGALDALGAERLGHGVRCIEDAGLVGHLAERGIPIEVCPTSNLCLSVYPDRTSHPLRRLHDAGVAITINSDDPPLFNTTLTDEVLSLADAFGLPVDAIDGILLNALRHSFLPADRALGMEQDFTLEMAALKAEHLR